MKEVLARQQRMAEMEQELLALERQAEKKFRLVRWAFGLMIGVELVVIGAVVWSSL